MEKIKIFILLSVILFCSVASAVIFKDHGGDSPINYINIDGVPSSNSIAYLKKGVTYKCVMGFAPEYAVAGYEFKMYIIMRGIPVPLAVPEDVNRQNLPWNKDQNIDLNFPLNIMNSFPLGEYSIKVEVIDNGGRTIVSGSFLIKIS